MTHVLEDERFACHAYWSQYMAANTGAHLAVPVRAGEHERRGALLRLRLEVGLCLDHDASDLLETRQA